MEGIIYIAENVVNSKVYIGKTTKSLDVRKRQHYYNAEKGSCYFYNALNKYKKDDWNWFIIDTAETEERLSQLEKLYIKCMESYKPANGYNSTFGGEGGIPNLETRAKLSAANKGRIITPETRAKLSAAGKGKKLTSEHKAKMSATNIANNNANKIKVMLIKTDKYLIMEGESKNFLETTFFEY